MTAEEEEVKDPDEKVFHMPNVSDIDPKLLQPITNKSRCVIYLLR